MGFETMRRWPVFIVFAFCLLLCVSLLNSWAAEGVLEKKLTELSVQVQQCSKQQGNCMEESLALIEQRDENVINVNRLEKEKGELKTRINGANQKALEKESQANRTQIDVDLCKTELQSLKNLQLSKSATLDTLRLEKDTLTSELLERKAKIKELEKEITQLKLALDGKTPAHLPAVPKVTPAAPPVKQSSVIGAPVLEPAVENNAKEDDDDINAVNDANFNDFNDEPNK